MTSGNVFRNKHMSALIVQEQKLIALYSSQRNGRNYKKKCWFVGTLGIHPKTNRWCFIGADKWALGYETMKIISALLFRLDSGDIVCDFEKGEFREV